MTDTEVVDQAARDRVKTDVGQTLFVEAGAGTGKTTALVGRIVELVLTDGPHRRGLGQIAAITFTEAAAAELRERIRAAFETRLHEARIDGDEVVADRCEQALAEADIAAISTLHSFAQRLLSEFPVEVGIPPRVEVVDEVRSQLAFDKRWSQFLDVLYEDPDIEEFIVRAAILGVALNSSAVRNIAQAFEDNWDYLLGISVSASPPAPINTDGVREKIHQVRAIKSTCRNPDDLMLANINQAEINFARFDRAESDHERLRVVRLIPSLKTGRGRSSDWEDLAATKELCQSLIEECQSVLEAVTHETLQRIAERIAVFTRESAEQRRAEGVLEFHDLLVLAHQLLRQSPEARSVLSQRYRVLMLDEFQDTDPIQISLATLLAATVEGSVDGNWDELPVEAGRLFFVGDPKQSIYRFRRADISLFLAAAEKFGDNAVTLQQNFRTVAPIIDVVNDLFESLMPERSEAQAKYTPLIPFRQPSSADHRPMIFGGPIEGKAGEIREGEAADVASIIESIRTSPQNWLVRSADGEWRAPQLRDITILLPTRTSMAQLSDALDALSIPFRADTGTLIYETQEIRDLLSVLAAIDDPSDQIALTAALRSPLYGCGYDDLYRFVQSGGSLDLHGYIPDELAETLVAEGIEHLRALAARKWWDEPSTLLQRVVDERFAMALPAAGGRARDAWRRIRYVIDQARAFSEAGGGDLRNYLDWTRLQGADGSRAHEPMLPEADDDAVQIMTIHGSKGLEFPITIVSGMTTRRGGFRQVGEVKWGDRGELPEVSISSSAKTRYFDLAKELDDEMDEPERDRLLYVALTRAKDHLAVSGYHPVSAKGKAVECLGLKVHTWATESGGEKVRWLVDHHGDSETDAETGDTQRPQVVSDAPSNAVAQLEFQLEPSGGIELQPPDAWRAAHRERLEVGGAQSSISATALARSVRESVEDEALVDSIEADPDPLVSSGDDGVLPPREFRRGRTGTAIGSAVHGVLQLLDLANPTDVSIAALSESQAWAESIPEHHETVRSAVTAALQAPIVAACATARHWKELYVATPIGSLTVEGYIDLLVETPDGLVVVDYKTDSVPDEQAVETKVRQYRLQGAAYAVAVENATARKVVDVQFVFCRSQPTIVRGITDLDAARSEVREFGNRPSALSSID